METLQMPAVINNLQQAGSAKYVQPAHHDGTELYSGRKGKQKGDILVIQRDFRADCVSMPFLSMKALSEMGWRVVFEDPWAVIGPRLRGGAFGPDRVPVPLALSDRARARGPFDAIVINNHPNDWNCMYHYNWMERDPDHYTPPVVFIYDEPWKGPVFPKGAEYCLTYKGGWEILNNAVGKFGQLINRRKHMGLVRGTCFDGILGAIYPPVWPDGLNAKGEAMYVNDYELNTRDETGVLRFPKEPEGKLVLRFPQAKLGEMVTIPRTTKLAYNGMLREDFSNQMMKVAKQRITKWAAENIGCRYWFDPGMKVDVFLDFVPTCEAALHYSASDTDPRSWDGVGQGAWENMIAGCVTFEYPFNEGAVKEGMVDKKTCLFFDNEEQLAEKWAWLQKNPAEGLQIARAGREVALAHSYTRMGPALDRFFTQIVENNKADGRTVGQFCPKEWYDRVDARSLFV